MSTFHRGALIVVEGLDRAGKSTQCQRLAINLEKIGHNVRQMRFPNRSTPIGKSIDAYLKGESQIEDHVVHLLFSANRWEAAAGIRNDIARGTTVIIDRYSYSGAVYSAAKRNPELDLEWAWQPEIGLPQPDVLLFLNITPEAAARRGGFGDEKYETSEMQVNVEKLFRELISSPAAGSVVEIDASQSLEQVEHAMLEAAQRSSKQWVLEEKLKSFIYLH